MATKLVLTGIGGQGTILWTKLMCNALHLEGVTSNSMETLGGMQRGGPVYVQLQFGDGVVGGAVPYAAADLVFAQEVYEGMRMAAKFLKTGGTLLQNEKIVPVVGHFRTRRGFIKAGEYEELMPAHVGKLYSINAHTIAEEAGNARAENAALWGVAVGLGLVPHSTESAHLMIDKYLTSPMSAAFSHRAFDGGVQAATDGRVETRDRTAIPV